MRIVKGMIILILLIIEIETSFVIAIHGGAGGSDRESVDINEEIKIKKGILTALKAGYEVLRNNGSSVDAVQEAIIRLEDNPIFNAGKGAKINKMFKVELDASIMNGKDLSSGAVASVKYIKNPIKAARKVMTNTAHNLLVGEGADNFAKSEGLEIVPNLYFFTWKSIKEWIFAVKRSSKMGTVGAVALDSESNLAAATSTGGTTNKMEGRVGDSPIIGAGNYANNKSCAVSCTGIGEVMIKNVLAYDIHARMIYKNIGVEVAANEVMQNIDKGDGGLIALDKRGNLHMPYNTFRMARGYVRKDGTAFIYVFGEGEDLTPVEYDIFSN
jgi:beta-aspartyl-peptidase (threonine type)